MIGFGAGRTEDIRDGSGKILTPKGRGFRKTL